jgi:hypothetical protein
VTPADDEPQPKEREPGFYWVRVGRDAPEIAAFRNGRWWCCGLADPWPPNAVTVLSDRLVMRPDLRIVQ